MLAKDVYNVAFGDYDELTDTIDDKVVTNNFESQKVLATVASTLYVFTNKHPNIWIYATGSHAARTRLYSMGITTNLEKILPDFDVYGLKNEVWHQFEKEWDLKHFWLKEKFFKFAL